jgi:hypothetical protein
MYELILAIVVQIAVVGALYRWAFMKQRRTGVEAAQLGRRGAHGRH